MGGDRLTNGEKIKILEKWKACHDKAEEMEEKIQTVFGDGESAHSDLLWGHFDIMTGLVALILGDKAGWCSWYAMECDFGRKAMEAGPKDDQRKIHNFNRLLWVIGATA